MKLPTADTCLLLIACKHYKRLVNGHITGRTETNKIKEYYD